MSAPRGGSQQASQSATPTSLVPPALLLHVLLLYLFRDGGALHAPLLSKNGSIPIDRDAPAANLQELNSWISQRAHFLVRHCNLYIRALPANVHQLNLDEVQPPFLEAMPDLRHYMHYRSHH